jgi:hypothetical protein
MIVCPFDTVHAKLFATRTYFFSRLPLCISQSYMNQQRMYARSTKIKEEEEWHSDTGIALDNGENTHCIHAEIIDAGQIYTDQTGRFPVVSSKENTYIMVLYEYDGKAILAETIKIEPQWNC